MKRISFILDRLNVLDATGRLSLTNLALIALVVKMLFASNLDWPAVVTLVTVFANYAHKRQIVNGASEAEASIEMRKIKEQYEKAVVAQAEVIKQTADQVKNLSQAFQLSNLVKKS